MHKISGDKDINNTPVAGETANNAFSILERQNRELLNLISVKSEIKKNQAMIQEKIEGIIASNAKKKVKIKKMEENLNEIKTQFTPLQQKQINDRRGICKMTKQENEAFTQVALLMLKTERELTIKQNKFANMEKVHQQYCDDLGALSARMNVTEDLIKKLNNLAITPPRFLIQKAIVEATSCLPTFQSSPR